MVDEDLGVALVELADLLARLRRLGYPVRVVVDIRREQDDPT